MVRAESRVDEMSDLKTCVCRRPSSPECAPGISREGRPARTRPSSCLRAGGTESRPAHCSPRDVDNNGLRRGQPHIMTAALGDVRASGNASGHRQDGVHLTRVIVLAALTCSCSMQSGRVTAIRYEYMPDGHACASHAIEWRPGSRLRSMIASTSLPRRS